MFISDDGERLETGGRFRSPFFDDSSVETIYLDFAQPDFDTMLSDLWNIRDEVDESNQYIEASLRYKDKVFDRIGASYRGNSSFFFNNQKRSYSIDLEFIVPGQDINGYNEFKLNNGSSDPSGMREVLFPFVGTQNIPMAKSGFVNLIVNGENHGLYILNQKLDKDHVKEWFLDNDATRWRAGNSALNNLGPDGSDYVDFYELRSSSVDDPYQDLANALSRLGLGVLTTEGQVDQLNDYLDVDASLWFLAMENIFWDDDGYIQKGFDDFFVYFDVATQRIVPIEYDSNSVLKTAFNWPALLTNFQGGRQLMTLWTNPALRERYLAHYRTIVEETFYPDLVLGKIDEYAALIGPVIAQPAVESLYTYDEFLEGVESLKTTYNLSYSRALADVALLPVGPTIDSVVDSVAGQESVRPRDDQSVDVVANLSGVVAQTVNLYYGTGLMGRFTKMAMALDDNGQFSAVIPPQAKGEFVRYYIEAIADNAQGTASYSPKGAEHDVYIYQVQSAQAIDSALVINELMASNSATVADETGNFGDWIELYNNSDQDIDLTGWYLTDEDTNLDRWAFPAGTLISANDTLVIWADDQVQLTTGLHASFKLSAEGESVYLVTPELAFADRVTFADAQTDVSFARSPNATGEFSYTNAPSFDAVNN
jgi:spore coat protein CotH